MGTMEAWDSSIDGLEPSPEYRRDRRRVLLATFSKLRRLAESRSRR